VVEGEERMRGSRRRLILLVIVAAASIFVLLKHILVSDEERIRKVLSEGKAAIEREDLQGVMTQVSHYYRDEYGLNYLGVRALFKWVFEEFDDIAIHVEGMEVEILENDKGKATLLTWATAKGRDKTGYIVGGAQQPCRVIITLEKERGKWRVIRATGVKPGEVFL